jgi:hypothetical protein
LADSVSDRLRRRLKLIRQFLGRAAGAYQLDHLATEFRCGGLLEEEPRWAWGTGASLTNFIWVVQ